MLARGRSIYIFLVCMEAIHVFVLILVVLLSQANRHSLRKKPDHFSIRTPFNMASYIFLINSGHSNLQPN